ncbi:TPM domain-containing protein [Chitiniphilus eburneus]|uniref:TPM domain-containing protein n=1 Tax=Chitiniphilus eburneus TaxID=2571148 RepID=UPI001FEBC7CD|nr:YgcG family protein [Chitiniphilus eburneus]
MRALCCALLWLLSLAPASAEVAVPVLTQRVIDLTHTLSAEQQAAVTHRLQQLEHNTGSQLAVLLVPTTAPETIEQYSIRVAEAWKLGRKGVDDGVLLLVAKDDRKVRIEVGYGLEGALTDATTGRIIREQLLPAFRQGDFAGGVSAGVEQLAHVIDGEPLPPPAEAGIDPVGILILGGLGMLILFFIVFFVIVQRQPASRTAGNVRPRRNWTASSAAGSEQTSSGSHSSGSGFSGGGGGFGGGGASGGW